MDTKENATEESQNQEEQKQLVLPMRPEDDPRFNLVEEIATKLDDARKPDFEGVPPAEQGPKAKQPAAKQEEPPREEESYEAKLERELYEKKLSLINSNEDIPLETLDKIGAATTMDELKKIEAELTLEPARSEKAAPDSSEEEYFEVVINGKRRRVTKEELIEYYQKTSAADEYLEKARAAKSEAEKLRKELEELKRQLYLQQSAPQTAATSLAQPASAGVSAPQIDEAKLAELAKRLAYGDEDEYKKALKDLTELILQNARPATGTSGGSGQRLLTEEEARQIARTEAERKLAEKAIQARFFTEYEDLAKDDLLFFLVNVRAAEKIDAGRDRYDWETYDEAAREIRAWWNRRKAQARPREDRPSSTTQDLPKALQEAIEERRRKKLQLDVIEGAKSAQRSGSSREPMTEDEIRREGLADIVKSRPHPYIGTGY